jgi:NAD(P)-dependent dehydrogenase (short-subunit alcohol dehydrogenase family)
MTTKQAPLHTGFGATTTAREVVGSRKLAGTIAIVTGGYVGVGLETTRAFSEAGATVIVPARSRDKAHAALEGIANVEIESLDLFDRASIEAFSSRFIASKRPLHFLFNNAGIMAVPLARNAQGYESQFATNHLGHFLLTARLWPALKNANGARVIALSSRGHAMAPFSLDDVSFDRKPYDKWIAYSQSKSANALFALALDTRGESHKVRAFSVHPGAVATELSRHVPEEELRMLRANLKSYKNPEQGAATSVWCATSEKLEAMGGVYCEDVDIAEALPADSKEARGVRPWAMDRDLADQLWKKSEEMLDARFSV